MLVRSDVEKIFESSLSTTVLAQTYGVSTNTIRSIKRRRSHTQWTSHLLVPGIARKSNRHILDDETVWAIYKFTGNTKDLKYRFGISKKVAMNIKFQITYSSVTQGLGPPGELKVHKLTWDDVCTIRASNLGSAVLAGLFGVSTSTVNNIIAGRTRTLK